MASLQVYPRIGMRDEMDPNYLRHRSVIICGSNRANRSEASDNDFYEHIASSTFPLVISEIADLTEERHSNLNLKNYTSGMGSGNFSAADRARISFRTSTPEILDLTEELGFQSPEDYLTEEKLAELLAHRNELGFFSTLPDQQDHRVRDFRRVNEISVEGDSFKPGRSVELTDGTFLRIVEVLDDSGEIFLTGQHFVRLERMGTEFPSWSNELCWVFRETVDGFPILEDDVPLSQVKQFRTIHLTNCQYHNMNNKTASTAGRRGLGDLFCRLKRICVSDVDVAIHYLIPSECDEGFITSPSQLRESWRGAAKPFGSAIKHRACFPEEVIDIDTGAAANCISQPRVIDLTRSVPDPRIEKVQRQYTFGDGFCGAGGVSCGAQQAGLCVKWAFDKNHHAASSYRLNYADAICETADVFDFLTNHPDDVLVDVSHGSPPCQTYSPAHTVDSVKDDANSACIFSGWDVVKLARSRIHTMEETFGLLERHKPTFFGVIHDFLENGFSVRYKILNCVDYGIPQSRKRLFTIAAGPGEVLPQFPKPTHGPPGSGLLPYNTVRTFISNIPPGMPDHDIEGALSRGLRNGPRMQFNDNILARTITCSGGEFNYHPSGQRNYTNRELACLQTFPLTYRFGCKGVRKQIGNAVPPMLSKAVFREVIKSLQKTDEAELLSSSLA